MDQPMPEMPIPIQQKVENVSERLEQLPRHDSPETRIALTEIIRDIVVVRDQLILVKRRGEVCGNGLQKINAALSAIFGIEYPVSGLQWKRLIEACAALKALTSGQATQARN
jgi:hypothetical protein